MFFVKTKYKANWLRYFFSSYFGGRGEEAEDAKKKIKGCKFNWTFIGPPRRSSLKYASPQEIALVVVHYNTTTFFKKVQHNKSPPV